MKITPVDKPLLEECLEYLKKIENECKDSNLKQEISEIIQKLEKTIENGETVKDLASLMYDITLLETEIDKNQEKSMEIIKRIAENIGDSHKCKIYNSSI